MTCVTTSWTAHTAMPSGAVRYHRLPVWNGYIYFFVGTTARRYHPASDTWATVTGPPVSVSGMGDVQVAHNGKIYCFGGGFGSTYGGATAYDRTMIYDIAGDSWSQGASVPSGRLDAAAASDGTYIYVTGGLTSGATNTATVQRYNPAADTWNTSLASMGSARSEHEVVYDAGVLYALGGHSGAGTTDSTETYDIGADSWAAGSTMPGGGRSGFSAEKVGGWIYMGGGILAAVPQSSVYRYKIATATWENPSTVPALPEARWLPAFAVVDNTLWSIGGDNSGAWDGKTMCLRVATRSGIIVGSVAA